MCVCVSVCYIKDEQRSLRPDADVAIWPLTLIGVCVCMCLCLQCVKESVQEKKTVSKSDFRSSLKVYPIYFSFLGMTQNVRFHELP